MSQLEGKIGVVTGSTQGLGAAVVQLFAERGAAGLVTCGRSRDKGQARARDLQEQTGIRVIFVEADVTLVDDCRKVLAEADAAFGRVDAVVNAAGITDRGTIVDTTPELFDKMFAVNVRAPFFIMQEAIKLMRREHIQGTIVNVGSIVALAGPPFISAYCASKGALATLTRNTAYAVLGDRIRVNGINPGWMETEGEDRVQFGYHGHDAQSLEEASAALPFGRRIRPDEAAKAIAFLSSTESGLMTGSVINFDQSVWGGYDSAPPSPSGPLI